MKDRWFPAILGLWLPLAAHAGPRAVMFDASSVRLLDGPFKQRQELHRTGHVAALEVDRLLFPYRATAGLPQPAGVTAGYSGWDAGFIRGHMAGHYLSAASRLYAATGDESFRIKANALVDGLAACQEKLGTGHLAAFPEEVIATFETTGRGSHGIAVPYYTIHKVMAGLIDAAHYLGNLKALVMAERMADCYAKRMAALAPEQIEKLLHTGHQRNPLTEHGGMSDVLTELAAASGNNNHLKLARLFIRDRFMDPLAAGDDRLENLHANTHVAQAVGIARYASATGDPKATAAAGNFWKHVTRNRSFVIGGNSFKEWFDKPGVEAGPSIDDGRILPYNTAETCNTHNMLKLASRLFELSPDASLAAFHERALYNHILSSIDPVSGRVIYFHPLFGDFKTYLTDTECCEGSGIENTGRYGEGIYFHDEDSLFVNLYIPSAVHWQEKRIVIRQEGSPPWRNAVDFTVVSTDAPVEFSVKLRVPDWLADQPRVGGIDPPKILGIQDGYLTVRRIWKSGDRFRLELPPALRLIQSKDDPSFGSALYGPLVLAARLGRLGMPEDVGSKDMAARIPRPEVPAVVTTAGPSQWLKLSDPASLTFRAEDCGPASGLLFSPVHEVHHERFAVYFPCLTPAQSAARTNSSSTPVITPDIVDPRVVDSVSPGVPASEKSKDLAAEESIIGIGPQGRPWRDASPHGWFSYHLGIEQGKACNLVCTYWGEDRDRSFEVSVNGHKIATQTLDGSMPASYIDVTHPIPANALEGQQHANIRFQGTGKGRTGGVFSVRIERRDP